MTLGYWNTTQIWSILIRHAQDDIIPLRLQELCHDDDRVSSLVAVHNSSNDTNNTTSNHILIVDLSRQRITLETLNHLFKLTVACNLRKFITKLAWGQNCNFKQHPILPKRAVMNMNAAPPSEAQQQQPTTTGSNSSSTHKMSLNRNNKTARFQGEQILNEANNIHSNHSHAHQQQHQQQQQQQQQASNDNDNNAYLPSMHMSLRAPKGCEMVLYDGNNALDDIHNTWDRIQQLSESIRNGKFRGITNQMIQNVVVVGRGVSICALKFIYNALQNDETAILASRFGLLQQNMEHSSSSTNNINTAAVMNAGSQAANSAARMIRRTVTGNNGSNTISSNNSGNGINSSNRSNSSSNPATKRPPAARQLYFLSSVDPVAAARIMRELDPATTIVISLALRGNEETGLATKMLKTWLLQQPLPKNITKQQQQSSQQGPQQQAPQPTTDVLLAKHMMLVTGNDHIASVINKPQSVYLIPNHSRCEAFITFSAASLLPLSIIYGWSICQDFLAGAHDMDIHFVETNPRHNLPVLLALSDVWNNILLSGSGSSEGTSYSSSTTSPSAGGGLSRVIIPCTLAFESYPAFVGALEAQTCGNTAASRLGQQQHQHISHGNGIRNAATGPALVIDGGLNGSYDRAYYQSDKIFNSELIMAMDIQLGFNTTSSSGGTATQNNNNKNASSIDGFHETQDALMCTVFAHADELAFGCDKTAFDHLALPSPMSGTSSIAGGGGGGGGGAVSVMENINNTTIPAAEVSHGNRPSTLLMCGKLDAFACGQLVALAEHRALVKAHLWGIDPFASEVGCSLRMQRTEQLRDELQTLFNKDEVTAATTTTGESETEETGGTSNMSTRTILQHYADLVRTRRAPKT